MIEEGSRVRLLSRSDLARRHPEMAGEIGVVGSIVRGRAWESLGASAAERARDTTMHVRFGALNLVALNVPSGDVEPVDHIGPGLRVV